MTGGNEMQCVLNQNLIADTMVQPLIRNTQKGRIMTMFPYVDKVDTRAHVIETVSGFGTYVTNLTRGSSSWTFD
jgi:hypothetical protein